jgi:acyl-coenzyme A thioesterase PaaI-like protein
MTVHYLAPGKVGPVRAVGELLRGGARVVDVEVRVFDIGQDGRLMAVALAAFVSEDPDRHHKVVEEPSAVIDTITV